MVSGSSSALQLQIQPPLLIKVGRLPNGSLQALIFLLSPLGIFWYSEIEGGETGVVDLAAKVPTLRPGGPLWRGISAFLDSIYLTLARFA